MRLRAFRFETDFAAAPPPIAPAPPAYSEEELAERVAAAEKAARDEAYARGFEEGWGRAAAEGAEKFNESADQLTAAIEGMLTREDAAYEDIQRQGTRLLAAVISRISDRAAGECVDRSLEGVIERALHASRSGATLALRAAAQNAARLREALSPRLKAFIESGRITIEADPALDGHAMRLDWKTGGVDFDPGARAEQIQAILRSVTETLDDRNANQRKES